MASDITDLRLTIEKMIQDAQPLLGATIKKAGLAYKRAKRAKSEWTERYRLLVLIQAAQESLRMLPGSMREPWLLAQLSACLEVVRKWREDPSWKEMEPCLVNASDFSHVISMLMLFLLNRGFPLEDLTGYLRGVRLDIPFRRYLSLYPETTQLLIFLIREAPDATQEYVQEIKRLERENLQKYEVTYTNWKKKEGFDWNWARKYLGKQ